MLIAMQAAEKVWTRTWISDLSAWVALGFLGLLGIAILIQVFREKIDLSGLISEPSGEASMSRFQLLIFTFVIAASLFLVIASAAPPELPKEIPNGILVLLGISSSSYLVSKGIQQSSPNAPQVTISGSSNNTSVGGPSVHFTAAVVGVDDKTVIWSVDPPTGNGSIDAAGEYTPPAVRTADTISKVTIKAACKADMSLTDTETIDLV